jgi:DNA repair ATPase RecN
MKVTLDTSQLDEVTRSTIKELQGVIRKHEAHIARLTSKVYSLQTKLDNLESDRVEINNIKNLAQNLVKKIMDERWVGDIPKD